MIKNIQSLRRFGIFQDYTNKGVQDFRKYNLFYGWNGSGKSTLSRLFRCIENCTTSDEFRSAEFTVNVDGDSRITQANINEASLKIYTFNHDFIEENISWNDIVKSILLIDKKKITERKKLEQLKKQQEKDTEAHREEREATQKLEDDISKFLTGSARRIKSNLQAIDTKDTYYLNYDKRKFKSFITDNQAIKADTLLLDSSKITELIDAAKPNQKSLIKFTEQKLKGESLSQAKTDINTLLKTNVISQTIQRLVDHADIKTWVEAGLKLHNHRRGNQCEFCGNTITKDRIKQLEEHFNDDYKVFQDKLEKHDQWLSDQSIQQPSLPSKSEFYDEFKQEYSEACEALGKDITALNDEISKWRKSLKKKIDNPLETNLSVSPISVKTFNESVTAIDAAVRKHNYKSNNFETETKKVRKQLELHYAATEVKEFDYYEKVEEVASRTAKRDDLWETINGRETEIRTLEDSLSDAGLGAERFNESLRKFLGYSELTLRFSPEKKGYEILRNGSEPVDGKLSEGEKTAIAFVYFVTKMKENDNEVENTIVIVDDPVSSFDSNHLFSAYSFLRDNCRNTEQLFVLTHNFTYFKLVRDWFKANNESRGRKNSPKGPSASFYTIEVSTGKPRCSTIKNADSSLVDYNSEYHYIFSRLHEYKDSPTLSRDAAFLTANLARKLLESFFSFKYPRHRSDLARLMADGLKGCETTDEVKKEKIYRFINKYSHSLAIEVNEDSSENLIGESQNVIGDIFTWLREVDEVHYEEMLEMLETK